MVATEVSFRKAEPVEANAIAGSINRAFAVERFFIDGDRTSPEKVRELFGTGDFLVAEDGKALVGCVYVERREDRAYVGLLSIEPARQRSGLGSRLMAAVEDRARKAGATPWICGSSTCGRSCRAFIVGLGTPRPGQSRSRRTRNQSCPATASQCRST